VEYYVQAWPIPLLFEEGCPRHQQMAPFRSRGRGGRSAAILQNAFRNIISQRPPRLPLRMLRTILLMSQPPLLEEEGNMPRLYALLTIAAPRLANPNAKLLMKGLCENRFSFVLRKGVV
jgi:hypothetical protein